MRFLKVLALVPLLVLTACDQKKSDADSASGAGVAGTTYNTSPESNAKFLADYAARPGVTKTADGLMYRVLKAGNGPQLQNESDLVTVFYKGSLIDGKVFDETKPDEPAQFPAGRLIPGWVEALKLMKTGDTWEIALPPELG
jgi:FKBP-type peptidyl-prolyl cis-trans isomerase